VPYRLVIFLTVLYFYISSPILIFIALSIVLHINRTVFLDPVDLAVTVSSITIGFYIIRAIVQNAFISIRIREPNRLLLQFEAPTLWALTSEIAARVGTRSVDAIIIVPGPKIAISEQGELLTCLLGRGSRVLVLGFGILNGLNQAQLKALLAHDYGHFVNGETAGGHNALRLRTVLVQMKRSLIAANRDHPLNPAWLFVSFFTPLVARITLGAARHQELLADRVAARAYGRQNLIDGLRQVITQENTFNLQVEREIEKAQDRKRHLDNLYQLPELDSREVAAADTSAMFLMNQTATVYDSHPAPNVRIELLQALVDEGEAQSTVAASVWRLLRNPEPLQLEMTGVVQQLVATHALHRTDSNVSASSRA
jgi:Zn-dependent protease with chaperone function